HRRHPAQPSAQPLRLGQIGPPTPRRRPDRPAGGERGAVQSRGGRRAAHGCAASKAAEAATTARSAKRRPTICNPTGNPAAVKPTGTVAAGCPVRLKGKQNGIQPRGETGSPLISLTAGRATGNGGTATVGVIKRSKRARKRCTSVQSSCRRRAAARY